MDPRKAFYGSERSKDPYKSLESVRDRIKVPLIPLFVLTQPQRLIPSPKSTPYTIETDFDYH